MVAPPVSGRLDSNRVRLVDLEDCEVLMESGFTRMLALSCVDGEITDTPAQCDESETFAVHVSIGVGQEELFTITHLPTGLAIGRMFCNQADAWAVVGRLNTLEWDWTNTDHHYFETMRQRLDKPTRRWLELIKF